MKKIVALILLLSFLSLNTCVYAAEEATEESSLKMATDAPVWADYVAPKYQNPKNDFSKGASIAELSVGIVLTELIITAPIGIPMTVHGTTKVKMISYANRKRIFDESIAEAVKIQDPSLRKMEYKQILKTCHLKESTKKHYEKKYAKQKAKEQKKQEKLAKKQAKKAK